MVIWDLIMLSCPEFSDFNKLNKMNDYISITIRDTNKMD